MVPSRGGSRTASQPVGRRAKDRSPWRNLSRCTRSGTCARVFDGEPWESRSLRPARARLGVKEITTKAIAARLLRPVRADRLWPTATAVGMRQMLTFQPASAGDRIAPRGPLFLSPLPGLVRPLAQFSRGWEGVKKSIALTTETRRHRGKALSFQFSVPLCLCSENAPTYRHSVPVRRPFGAIFMLRGDAKRHERLL